MCIYYTHISIYIYMILYLILSAVPVRFCMSIQLQTPFRAHVNIRPTEMFAMAMIKYDQGTNLGSNIWVIFKDSKSNINLRGIHHFLALPDRKILFPLWWLEGDRGPTRSKHHEILLVEHSNQLPASMFQILIKDEDEILQQLIRILSYFVILYSFIIYIYI